MELDSDQGPNFESRLMQDVLERLRVNKTRTTPLRQSEGMVERYVKTTEEQFKVVATHQREWDERPQCSCWPTERRSMKPPG